MPIKKLPAYKPARVAPRKHEVEALVQLLESDEFTSADQMARKVLATAFELMAGRDWFVVASRLDSDGPAPVVTYGFFATESAAMKAIEKNSLGLFGKTAILEVKSLLDRSDYLTAEEQARVDALGCAACDHSYEAHYWPRYPRDMCAVCGCRSYIGHVAEPTEIEIV